MSSNHKRTHQNMFRSIEIIIFRKFWTSLQALFGPKTPLFGLYRQNKPKTCKIKKCRFLRTPISLCRFIPGKVNINHRKGCDREEKKQKRRTKRIRKGHFWVPGRLRGGKSFVFHTKWLCRSKKSKFLTFFKQCLKR